MLECLIACGNAFDPFRAREHDGFREVKVNMDRKKSLFETKKSLFSRFRRTFSGARKKSDEINGL